MFFKLKSRVGNHAQKGPDGKVVIYYAKDGNIIESNTDLSEKHPTKFERVDVPGSVKADTKKKKSDVQKAAKKGAKDIAPKKEKEEEDLKEEEEEEEEKEQIPLGKNVTKSYKMAKDQDLKVFYKRYKGRFVTEAEDVFTAVNKKPLKKAEVNKFIEKWLKE